MRSRILCTQLLAVIFLLLPELAKALPNQIQIVRLEVPPGLPAPPGNLDPLRTSVRLEAVANGIPENGNARLVLQIRKAGILVCGNAPASAISVRVSKNIQLDASTLNAAWTGCTMLEPGTYSICARFYGAGEEPLSAELCSEFQVAATGTKQDYTPPVNLTPADRSFELEERARNGLRFSWKPVSPDYPGPVTYRLRIWKIPAGKDAAAAVLEGKPVFSRDLTDATETVVGNALALPCTPGTNCSFAWNIQALNAAGQAIGGNKGTSTPSALSVTTYAIRLDKIAVSCTPTPGVYSFSFALTNPNIGTAKLSNFLATSSLPAGAAITSFAPPLNTNIPAGSQLTITGTITASPGLSTICIGAQITDIGNGFWQASKDTCIPVKPCKCEACDPKRVNIQTPAATVTINANNTVTLTQPVSVTTTPAKLIKAIRTELVYFAFSPDDEACMPCNRDTRTFGNLLAGTIGSLAGSGGGAHTLEWAFVPPKPGTGVTPFNATISLPPMVKCCDATLRFCVRYVITFADCTACSKLVCYEKRLDGCSTSTPSTSNN